MNERIRKLAEEHGFIHEYMTIGERNDALTKYREFAELIVKECAKVALDCDVIEYNDLRQGIAQEIKRYFSVKES